MTNTERIQANNAELRECIELAENLPEAGTSVEVVLQSKTVTPTKETQDVIADTGYTALEKVTVNAIPDNYVITTDANATAGDMRKGKTAYVDGTKITGSIEDFDGSYECSGDSTGGVNIETCVVTVENILTYMVIDDPEYDSLFVYTDGSLNSVSINLPIREGAGWDMEPLIHTFTVAKGTLVYAPFGLFSPTGDGPFTPIIDGYGTFQAAIVNGDCTVGIG